MRDLCSGERKKIFGKDVKYINVPQYDGLDIKQIKKFGQQYVDVNKALPVVNKEIDKLPRGYLCNVIYTIAGNPFREWVSA